MTGIGIFPDEQDYHNILINPDFLIAQEGTSFAAMADDTYILDGYAYYKSGSMVHTGSQATDVPTVAESGSLSTKSLLVDCTTADASIAAGDYAYVAQFVEGYRALPILQKTFTLRFWHKHTKTGTYCVAFKNSGSDRTYVAEYTQTTTDTQELASITVSASPSAGTWDYTNGIGLQVIWSMAAGSTYQTTADTWATGDYLATSSQVNACDSTSNNFRLSKAWLFPGNDDVEFLMPTYKEQLFECQRYYEKSYNMSVTPGTSSTPGFLQSYIIDTFSVADGFIPFKATKRATPAVTIYNTNNGTANQFTRINAAGTFQANSTGAAYDVSENSSKISLGGNGNSGDFALLHYVSDARLRG